jgi:protein-tyrosine phosphatase
MRILCVCLGNICRSPLAEGVLRARAAGAGLALDVDSAGTGGWHVGDPPHLASRNVAADRGYDLSRQRARLVAEEDFRDFDLMLAMDHANLGALARRRPAAARAELRLFDPWGRDIPDPYGDDLRAYAHVLDMIEAGADALVAELAAR